MASQSPKSSSPICWFVALTCPCNTCRYKMIYTHITSEQIILYIYNIYELYTTFQLRFIWPNQAVCGVIDASSPLLGSLIFFVTSHICIHFLQPVFKRPLDFSMGRSETNTSTWERRFWMRFPRPPISSPGSYSTVISCKFPKMTRQTKLNCENLLKDNKI